MAFTVYGDQARENVIFQLEFNGEEWDDTLDEIAEAVDELHARTR